MSIDELKAAFPKPDQLSPAEIEAKAESLGRCENQDELQTIIHVVNYGRCLYFDGCYVLPSHR